MSPRRTNVERSRTTRGQLLEAGRRLFAERGYHETSMAQVAAAGRLSTGALYHHWPTKRELLAAVVGAIHHELAVEVARLASPDAAPLTRFQHAAAVFLRRCADRDVARILLVDGPTVLGATWDELDRRWWHEPTRRLLSEAMDDGAIVRADPGLLATALLGSLTALGRDLAAEPAGVAEPGGIDPLGPEAVLSTLLDGLRARH